MEEQKGRLRVLQSIKDFHSPPCSPGTTQHTTSRAAPRGRRTLSIPAFFRSRDGKFSESRESSPGSSPCKCKNRAWRRAAQIGESRCDDKARRGDTGLLSTGACSKGANGDITTRETSNLCPREHRRLTFSHARLDTALCIHAAPRKWLWPPTFSDPRRCFSHVMPTSYWRASRGAVKHLCYWLYS